MVQKELCEYDGALRYDWIVRSSRSALQEDDTATGRKQNGHTRGADELPLAEVVHVAGQTEPAGHST